MFLFFDTEKTIRVNDTPRIIEMGWVLTDDKGVEFRSQFFIVCPNDFDISLSTAHTRRITTKVAQRNGMKIGAVLDAFAKDVSTADVLVAHNPIWTKASSTTSFSVRSVTRYSPVRSFIVRCGLPPISAKQRRAAAISGRH